MARVLVIDDEADIGLIIKTFLTLDGHSVDVATDGKEGLKLANKHAYNLVVTDVIMPECDGLEVLQNLRKSFMGMGILVITGGSPTIHVNDLEQVAIAMGADKVMFKVLDYSLLRSTVKELIMAYE